MTRLVASFGIGATMAAGFVLAGLSRPETIVQYLDFTGDWNPSILLVMAAALTVTSIAYRLIWRRGRPLLEPKFYLPTRRDIDVRLVAGSALFGLGWGLVGLCPGPALASVGTLGSEVLVWLGAVFAGMWLFKVFDGLMARRAKAIAETSSSIAAIPAGSLGGR